MVIPGFFDILLEKQTRRCRFYGEKWTKQNEFTEKNGQNRCKTTGKSGQKYEKML